VRGRKRDSVAALCVGAVRAPVRCEAVAAMNESERTDVQILLQAAFDFIEHMANGWDVDHAESADLRHAMNHVLGHVYFPDDDGA
jgi:hypothetical protein